MIFHRKVEVVIDRIIQVKNQHPQTQHTSNKEEGKLTSEAVQQKRERRKSSIKINVCCIFFAHKKGSALYVQERKNDSIVVHFLSHRFFHLVQFPSSLFQCLSSLSSSFSQVLPLRGIQDTLKAGFLLGFIRACSGIVLLILDRMQWRSKITSILKLIRRVCVGVSTFTHLCKHNQHSNFYPQSIDEQLFFYAFYALVSEVQLSKRY